MIAEELVELSTAIQVPRGSRVAGRTVDLCISSLGATVLGSQMSIPGALAGYVREMTAKPEARVLGFGFATSVELAAMVNCVACHATEYEDVSWPEGQYTCCLIPAMFSLGEHLHSSGSEMIEAIVGGFEAAAGPVSALGSRLSRRGFLGSAVFGTIGVAAGAARLMKLDRKAARDAVTLAASMSAGLHRQTGSAAHVLEAGFAGRHGITAAMLASRGLSGNSSIMDGNFGFFDAFVGCPDVVVTGSGSPRILSVGQKKYPCAYPLQRIVDAFARVVVEYDVGPEDVSMVKVHVNAFFPRVMRFESPCNGEEARLSPGHVLAAFLKWKYADHRAFTDAAVNDPDIARLRARVRVIPHEDWGSHVLGTHNVVEVELMSGKTITAEQKVAHGDAEDPLTREETVKKFFDVTSGVLPADRQRQVVQQAVELQSLRDVAALLELVA